MAVRRCKTERWGTTSPAIVLMTATVLLLTGHVGGSTDKPVSIVLRSRWSDTSLLAEFVAEESNHLFWQFVDKVATQSASELEQFTPKQMYDFAVKTAEGFMLPARLDLLKFSLSVRAHSPQVEMFQQMALDSKEDIVSDCDSFFNINGRFTCSIEEVESLATNAPPQELPEVYSVDHHYPAGLNSLSRVIFFGKLGSASFAKAHGILKKLAKSKVDYVWRPYDQQAEGSAERAVLSGYGVELAIKSTEYKAQDDSKTKINVTDGVVVEEEDTDLYGFNFKTLKQLHPDVKHQLDNFKRSLQGRDEVTPLRVWQLQDLSFQAGQHVLNEGKTGALGALQEVSQNFPMLAHSLTRITVPSELRKEVEKNQEEAFDELGVSAGDSALFLNGMLIDLDTTDVFSLLDILKKEEKLSAGFFRMGYRREYLTLLTNIDLTQESASYAIDYRLGFPDFINNLDKDKQYKNWGNSVKMMVQPYFPGMIRPIARNFFTLVFIVNPAEKSSQALMKIAHGFFVHEIPIRIGLIFTVNTDKKVSGLQDAGVALLNYYNFVKTDRGSPKALRHITDLFDSVKEDRPITSEDVIKFFKQRFKGEDEDVVFGEDSDYDSGRQSGTNFVTNTGLSPAPNVLMNGVPLEKSGITADRFEETVINEIHQITPHIQRDILQNKLDDSMVVGDYIMNKPDVMPRLNERILNEKNPPYVDMTDVMEYYPKSVYEFKQLTVPQKTAFVIKNVKYLKKGEDDDIRPFTAWVVGDFDAKPARQLAYNAVKNLKSSNKMRLGFIHNPTNPEEPTGTISSAMQMAFRMLSGHTLRNFVTKLVKEEFAADLEKGAIKLDDLAVGGMNIEAFKKELRAEEAEIKKSLTYQSLYATRTLNLAAGGRALVANGRILGPLGEGEDLVTDDIALLEKYTLSSHATVIGEQIKLWEIETVEDKASDVIMRTSALIMADPVRKKRTWIVLQDDKFSGVTIPASDETTAAFDIVAIVDPLTREAQKIAPILRVLQKVINADVKLVMNCKPKLSEMPLKSFYRLVLEPELGFLPTGELRAGPTARFSGLPQKQLLTLHVNSPESWLVECVHTEHDLDNIRLDQVDSNEVRGDYELEHLLLEGHCFDEITSNPPRGLQFTLGTANHPVMLDTIVMANLGYFQLKASPGAWLLRLREGRSTDIYDITGYDKTESQASLKEVKVLMNKFTGKIVRIRVQKKPDKLEEHLLIDSSEKGEQSMWQSISSAITGAKSGKQTDSDPHETINIFSLASGHLYERLLRIMMLSVLKHAKGKNPVKFWLLKNYLSPKLKKVLPHMAEHYGFEYELVQYKWPRWLHQQTDKQRTIWGYKILFLDVLFPLDVKKIIFVDADQVVRTNLKELMDLDMDGAPYGYAPFCSSRTEMDGYRFWKDGYWRTHLAGRPYHISALYVVDLKKFRQIAAGDRLRGQYQGLSSDPNSLSNLDQDLPNNMIHQVKIKTLPQEWLWCETWCDDASKASAKTIDLCNNPQTKEPKLDAAKRIIAEWTDYDNEIKALLEPYYGTEETVAGGPGSPPTAGGDSDSSDPDRIEL